MFGIGSTEVLIILVVALIVVGPKSIPQIAKTIGKYMGEIRKVSTEFQRAMNAEVAMDEMEKEKKAADKAYYAGETERTAASQPAAPADADRTPTADATSAAAPVADAATEAPDIAPDSPLAQAVAKAQAEAAAASAAPSGVTSAGTTSAGGTPDAAPNVAPNAAPDTHADAAAGPKA